MSAPALSIVMAVFNDAERIPESLASVAAQTDSDWELIVVNDGSTDAGVEERLARAAECEPRLHLLQVPHGGLTRALIAGCAAARGEFIARLDAGDVMLPDRLRRQRQILARQPAVAFVSCWTEFCGPQWEPLYVRRGMFADETGSDILPTTPGANLRDGPTHHGSVMFRRAHYEAVGGYRLEFYYGQDWDLWYRLAERGSFAMIPDVLYRARLFPESLSAGARRRQERIGRCSLGAFWARREGRSETVWLQRAAAIRPRAGSATRRARAEGCYFIGELLRQNRDPRCRRYFRSAWRSNPLYLPAILRWLQSLPLRSPL